jgi:hypothetical protein
MNVARTDSDAGWLATPSALVQFLDHMAGWGSIPSLLKPETIQVMTTAALCFQVPRWPSMHEAGWSEWETCGITAACRDPRPSWSGRPVGRVGQYSDGTA